MGRLKLLRVSKATYVRAGLLLAALVLAVFLYVRSSRLDEPSASQLRAYLKDHQLTAGTEIINDHQQVYFLYGSQRVTVTSGAANHTNPNASGRYIAWTETPYQQNSSLVVLYDVLTKARTQLSFSGNAQNLAIDQNHVVWEEQSTDKVRVKFYDGQKVIQLNDTYTAIHPSIRGDQIVYAEQVDANNWQVVLYNLQAQAKEIVLRGSQRDVAWPRFEGNRIVANQP